MWHRLTTKKEKKKYKTCTVWCWNWNWGCGTNQSVWLFFSSFPADRHFKHLIFLHLYNKALSLSLTVDNWLALEDNRSSSLKNQSQEEQHSWFGTKDGVSNDPPVCLWQSGEKREKKFTSRCTFTAEAPACHGSVHPGRHHFLMMQCSSLHYCYGQIWFQHRGFVFSR